MVYTLMSMVDIVINILMDVQNSKTGNVPEDKINVTNIIILTETVIQWQVNQRNIWDLTMR